MRKIKIFSFIAAAFFLTGGVLTAEVIKNKNENNEKEVIIKKPLPGKPVLRGIKRSDLEDILEDFEEEAEDLDKKLKKVRENSRQSIRLKNEREEISLEIIHRCQRYLLSYGSQKRAAKFVELLKKETGLLKTALKNKKDFPYPESLDNYMETMRKIRNGKLPYGRRVPKNYSVLLIEIQEKQKKALEEIHKKNLDAKRD